MKKQNFLLEELMDIEILTSEAEELDSLFKRRFESSF